MKSATSVRCSRWTTAGLPLLAMVARAVVAQVPEGPPTPLPEPTPARAAPLAPIDERKIDRFAAAYVVIEEIQKDTAEQMSKTTDSARIAQVKSEADKKIAVAIRRAGLNPEEFDGIAQRMASDAALRTRIEDKLAQRRKESDRG